MNIRNKLTILLLFIGLIPTLVVSIVAYVTISNELTTKTLDQLVSIAIKQEQKLNVILQRKEEEVIKFTQRYDLIDTLGQYFNSNRKVGHEALRAILINKKAELPEALGMSLIDSKGVVLASIPSSMEGATLEAGTYEIKPGQQATFALREDPVDKVIKLYITANITMKKESAILRMVFRIDDMASAIQDYTGLGTSGETMVSEKNDKGDAISLFALRFDPDAALKTKLNSLQLFEKSEAGYKDLPDYRNRDVIVATKSLAYGSWAIATKIDRSEALAPINRLRNSLIGIAITSSILIVGIALYFSRFFTAPILALTEKTKLIMQGDFTQRITVSSRDEVGALAVAYNKMTDELAASYEALERKVKERTKALNEKLRELEDANAKDDAILNSIGDGMVVTDSAGKILLMNTIAADLLQVDLQKQIGASITKIAMHDSSGTAIPTNELPMQLALRKGEKNVQEVKAADTKRVLSVTATPVLQQGKIIGAIQILRDITKEKEVDRMKTEFISIASHQLRTPLSAIRWFTEMLLSGDAGDLKPEQSEFAHNIADSTKRMIELVNSLLNISRMESGRIIVDPKPTDLKNLVSGIVNDLTGKTAEKDQTLIISIHKDLPIMNIDPHLIGQVYLNLLTNAIKYTPKGGEISVFVSRKGDEVVSQVTDNGYGIPKSEQAKLFQKFFRATNIVKVEADGTGLGMYLVKSIVETAGGKIWFESEEGKGTTFWFSLPLSGMKAKAGEVTIAASNS